MADFAKILSKLHCFLKTERGSSRLKGVNMHVNKVFSYTATVLVQEDC
jgi:hypothetical protein